jgi:hypothetical protein
VDDTAAMTRNVQTIWGGECQAMGRAARAHVVSRFSWEQTFERLIGEVYASALAQAAVRSGSANGTAKIYRPLWRSLATGRDDQPEADHGLPPPGFIARISALF